MLKRRARKKWEKISLYEFVSFWREIYLSKLVNVPIFRDAESIKWTAEAKKRFAYIFYHARGHFFDFLCILGNFSSSPEMKDIVLENIKEEFGRKISHEQLYIRFCNAVGIPTMIDEILNPKYNLPAIKRFNRGHVKWLIHRSPELMFSAFSAYELLDNMDYLELKKLAATFDVSSHDLSFFEVHAKVKHFDATCGKLEKIWERDREAVIEAFDFIGKHQLKMWANLSKLVLNNVH